MRKALKPCLLYQRSHGHLKKKLHNTFNKKCNYIHLDKCWLLPPIFLGWGLVPLGSQVKLIVLKKHQFKKCFKNLSNCCSIHCYTIVMFVLCNYLHKCAFIPPLHTPLSEKKIQIKYHWYFSCSKHGFQKGTITHNTFSVILWWFLICEIAFQWYILFCLTLCDLLLV